MIDSSPRADWRNRKHDIPSLSLSVSRMESFLRIISYTHSLPFRAQLRQLGWLPSQRILRSRQARQATCRAGLDINKERKKKKNPFSDEGFLQMVARMPHRYYLSKSRQAGGLHRLTKPPPRLSPSAVLRQHALYPSPSPT